MYGIPTEREPYIGISNAASEAWVMLPDQVHDGLRRKPLKEIRPEWFQLPLVQQVCVSAIERAGLAHSALREIRLFLALPHDVWMREHPQVRDRLQQFLDDAIGRGEKVAIKRHPLSREMLLNLPAAGVVEIPSRLPIEILAPLLPGAEIVGLLTSALLYLPRLGADIHVASFIPPNMTNNPIVDIYRKAGVRILA